MGVKLHWVASWRIFFGQVEQCTSTNRSSCVELCKVQKCVSVVEDDGVKEANNTTEVKWSCGAAMTAPGLTSVGFPTMESENMGHFGVVLFY